MVSVGLPISAIPEPTPIAQTTADTAATGYRKMQETARGRPSSLTPAEAAALEQLIIAGRKDREALRTLRESALDE